MSKEILPDDRVVLQVYIPAKTGRALHLAAGAAGDALARIGKSFVGADTGILFVDLVP
jgi:hypothetical protein